MKRVVGGILLFVGTLTLLGPAACRPENDPDVLDTIRCEPGKDGAVGNFLREIESGGRTRVYRLYVPTSYDPQRGHALVFNMHGFGSNMNQQIVMTGYVEKAERHGFIVVHPQGYEDSWNAGVCCGQAAAQHIDDVGFISDMIDELSAEYCIDPRYVFATGESNGGFMSHRLGCELADRIAAIGPVAGLIGIDTCIPRRPVPVLQTHGTRDQLVPYVEGIETVAQWAAINGCQDKEIVETYDDAVCEAYLACEAGATVEFCSHTGGHLWPVSDDESGEYDATDETWAFFREHPMP